MAARNIRTPSWARLYHFSIIAPKTMSHAALKKWKPLLDNANRIADIESVPVKSVQIHYHPNNPMDCPAGSAQEQTGEIMLCTVRNDLDTVLHEFAHLLAHGGHTELWAEVCILLYRKYLPKDEQEYAVWEACRVYKNARVVYRRLRKKRKLQGKKAAATRSRRKANGEYEAKPADGNIRTSIPGLVQGGLQPLDRPADEIRVGEYPTAGTVRSDQSDSKRQVFEDHARDERTIDCG